MHVLLDSKVKFVSVSQLLLALCSLFGSVLDFSQLQDLLYHLGEGKKKQRGKQKTSLLLTLNPLIEFCWSSWMP